MGLSEAFFFASLLGLLFDQCQEKDEGVPLTRLSLRLFLLRVCWACCLTNANLMFVLDCLQQEPEKAHLARQTGLTMKQLNNWFVNKRKRQWRHLPS